MTKAILRKQMLARRSALTSDEIAARSARIAARVLSLEAWKDANTVLAYYSVRGEADPAPLVQAAWDAGKRVYLPRTKGREMDFLPYTPDTRLVRSRYDIPEPAAGEEKADAWDLKQDAVRTLALVPGAAFSPEGFRIGYGGGYYDRYFENLGCLNVGDVTLVGLAYDFQITQEIRPEPHDVRLDAVAAESQMMYCG